MVRLICLFVAPILGLFLAAASSVSFSQDLSPELREELRFVVMLFREGYYSEAAEAGAYLETMAAQELGEDHTFSQDTRKMMDKIRLEAKNNPAPDKPLHEEKKIEPWKTSFHDMVEEESQLVKQKKFSEAVAVSEKIVSLLEENLGDDSSDLIGVLMHVAQLCKKAGDTDKSNLYEKKAVQLHEKIESETPQWRKDVQLFREEADKLYQKGEYEESCSFQEDTVKILEKELGDKDAETLKETAILGHFYRAAGFFDKAERLFLKAIDSLEKNPSGQEAILAKIYGGLAAVYRQSNNIDKAEPYYLKAKKLHEELYGFDSVDTAISYDNLGIFFQSSGDYYRSEFYSKRALKIFKEKLGPEHEHTVLCIANLGLTYKELNDYHNAEVCLLQSLAWRKKNYGSMHPSVAINLDNLGYLYMDMEDYAKAESYMKDALNVFEKTVGCKHPDAIINLENLSSLYKQLFRFQEAEDMSRRSLALAKEMYGPESPTTIKNMEQLASICRWVDKLEEGVKLREQVLKILENKLFSVHPAVVSRRYDLGRLYWEVGRHDESLLLLKESFAYYDKTIEEYYPSKAPLLFNLGLAYRDTGDYKEAQAYLDRACKNVDQQGYNSPCSSRVHLALAGLYAETGRKIEAKEELTKAIDLAFLPQTPANAWSRQMLEDKNELFSLLIQLEQGESDDLTNVFNAMELYRAYCFIDQARKSSVDYNLLDSSRAEELQDKESKIWELVASYEEGVFSNQLDKQAIKKLAEAYNQLIEFSEETHHEFLGAYNDTKSERDIVDFKEIQKRLQKKETAVLEYYIGKGQSWLLVYGSGVSTPTLYSLEIGVDQAKLLGLKAGPLTNEATGSLFRFSSSVESMEPEQRQAIWKALFPDTALIKSIITQKRILILRDRTLTDVDFDALIAEEIKDLQGGSPRLIYDISLQKI